MMVLKQLINIVIFIYAGRPAGCKYPQACVNCGVGLEPEPGVDQDVACTVPQSSQMGMPQLHQITWQMHVSRFLTNVSCCTRMRGGGGGLQCSRIRTCAIVSMCTVDGDAFVWLATDEREAYPEHLVDSFGARHGAASPHGHLSVWRTLQ